MGSVRSTFSARLKEESYLPPIGLAAAITAQRACRDVTMPIDRFNYAEPYSHMHIQIKIGDNYDDLLLTRI